MIEAQPEDGCGVFVLESHSADECEGTITVMSDSSGYVTKCPLEGHVDSPMTLLQHLLDLKPNERLQVDTFSIASIGVRTQFTVSDAGRSPIYCSHIDNLTSDHADEAENMITGLIKALREKR